MTDIADVSVMSSLELTLDLECCYVQTRVTQSSEFNIRYISPPFNLAIDTGGCHLL